MCHFEILPPKSQNYQGFLKPLFGGQSPEKSKEKEGEVKVVFIFYWLNWATSSSPFFNSSACSGSFFKRIA